MSDIVIPIRVAMTVSESQQQFDLVVSENTQQIEIETAYGGVFPHGTLTIAQNGIADVGQYANVDVGVADNYPWSGGVSF